MNFEQSIGDKATHEVPLTRNGAAFDFTGYVLIATAKHKQTDLDPAALFQKTSGDGITLEGSTASVIVLPGDTDTLTKKTSLYFGIRAVNEETNDRFTAFEGRLNLKQRTTREDQTSVPVISTEPPLPSSVTAAFAGASNAGALAGTEEVLLNQSGVVKATLTTIKAWLQTAFSSVFAAISHTHVSAAISDATTNGKENTEKLLKTDGDGDVRVRAIAAEGVNVEKPGSLACGTFTAPNITDTRAYECPDVDGKLILDSTLLAALGVPTYANLTAANAALTIGSIFYNTALSKLDITTA